MLGFARVRVGSAIGLLLGLIVGSPMPSRAEPLAAAVSDSTWVDHDGQPIQRPPDWEPSYWGRRIHQGLVEPLAHVLDVPDKLLWMARGLGARTRREAVNVNAFDEVPNSTWFTNRNHLRAVPLAELRQGPDAVVLPRKPWTLKHAKAGGWSAGFQIKDADGKKWFVKLDPRGHPQLGSGADMVARTLLHAAGYNVPHNEPVRFLRGDVTIDPELLAGAKGERFSEADLDSTLARGALLDDGSYVACASLFVAGHVLGSPSMNRLRPGDSNDRFSHTNRRELRGLFALCSWIDNWDTEDHQFLDAFVESRDSLGHVRHYLLDAGSSFGASAIGPKQPWEGHENLLDLAWTSRRIVTLGFVQEPWRRVRTQTVLASAGTYESEIYRPEHFRQLVPQPAFRELTDRDGYWGAKLVASFSDAQVAAAVASARYDDPRASERLVQGLIARRDKIARHWFGRVAPLDFFFVRDGVLHFRDLAVDIGIVGARSYDVEIESARGPRVHLSGSELPLQGLGSDAKGLSFEISVAGSAAKPAHVDLTRHGDRWVVSRVRHG